MSLEHDITIVSGLPRSGTSLMMQMLDRGGMVVLTDGVRAADVDNPRGYLELEKVKRIREDASWLPEARGKVFKMVSQLLYELPSSESYRVLFMQRSLEEILASQDRMLERLGRKAVPRSEMVPSYSLHLEKLAAWLARQPNFQVLYVSYHDLVANPESEAGRVRSFLACPLDVRQMAVAVDAGLYRNRTIATDHVRHASQG